MLNIPPACVTDRDEAQVHPTRSGKSPADSLHTKLVISPSSEQILKFMHEIF